jgi:PAS domain S-box-containing protein
MIAREVTNMTDDLERPDVGASYQLLFKTASEGVLVAAGDGRVLDANPEACALLLREWEEIVAAGLDAVLDSSDLRSATALREIREVGRFAGELLFLRGGGGSFPVKASITLYQERTGEDRFGIFFRDVTDRTQVEESLRESEERYRTFIERSSEGIWRKEFEVLLPVNLPEDEQIEHAMRHLILTEVNDPMARQYGYSRGEELEGTPVREMIPVTPENLESMRAFVRSGYQMSGMELQEFDRHGNVKYFSLNLVGIVEDGYLSRLWGIQSDVTERKESAELYRTLAEQMGEGLSLINAETGRFISSNASFRSMVGYTGEEILGMTAYDLIDEDSESVERNIRVSLLEGNKFFGKRKYRHKNGSILDVEVNGSKVLYGAQEVVCTVLRNVTESQHSDAALRRSLEGLLALREAGLALGSTLEPEEVVATLLGIMRRVSGITAAVISLKGQDGEMRIWRSAGVEELPQKVRYTPEAEAAREAAMQGRKVDPYRLRQAPGSVAANRNLIGLCLPLRTGNQSMGVLEVYGPNALEEDEAIGILSSLAGQAAKALENARLYQELSTREERLEGLVAKLLTTQEEERRRVAYEVHDGLAQVAATAYQHLQTFARRHPPSSEKGLKELERIVERVHQTVGEARRIIANLRPTVLDDFGLVAALRLEVEGLQGEGWCVQYEEEFGDIRLPTLVETTLFRIAQEALANVRKHAGDSRISIRLQRQEGKVRLAVRDWGRGFDLQSLDDKGGPGERVGLAGMQERAGMLSGELEVRSRLGAGTEVEVEFPLSAANRAREDDWRSDA